MSGQDSSDIATSSSSDDEDFTAYKSPGGKEEQFKQSPRSKKVETKGFGSDSKGSASNKTQSSAKKHGYMETTCDLESIGVLIQKVVTPNEPCQLINADAYKNLVLEMTPDIDPFNNSVEYIADFTKWALKSIKVYCKSKLAKEVLAGFKLLELLSAQLGKPFFVQLCCTRWADRIFVIWEETREPIHKLTIAQLLADWVYIFDGRVNVMPFRMIGQKLPLPVATHDAKTRRAAWEAKSAKSPAANSSAEGRLPSSPKAPKTSKIKVPKKVVEPKNDVEEEADDVEEEPAEEPAEDVPRLAVQVDYTGSMDETLLELFARFDYNGDGFVNSNSEMQQLVTNAIFKLKLMLPPAQVDERIEGAGNMDELSWTFDQFREWFRDAFAKEIKKAKLQ
eukprot:TRINITY_DN3552_c0_g1_i5.p1 TRINITY_DN3552_c0_g1~~TRINITY_DN3552_c0_g1_i5.p1  ORF type:complete len:393 (-),score=114.24 TRINITY_DN3552_c0_g1_i5:328-1506(-)